MSVKLGFTSLKEEYRLRGCNNRMLREIFGPKRKEDGENCMMRNFIICTLCKILLG
jgi:hypothetical protein